MKFYNEYTKNSTDLLFEKKIQKEFHCKQMVETIENKSTELDIKNIHRISSFYDGGCDLIVVENNFNDLDTFRKLSEFSTFCNNSLSPNGKIIICYFDINKISDSNISYFKISSDSINTKLSSEKIDYLKPQDNITEENIWSFKLENILESTDVKHVYENLNQYELPVIEPNRLTNEMKKTFIKYHILCGNFHGYKFKSKKLISKNQTILLSTLFDVDFELLSNAYDYTFNYLSIYHSVDVLYGSDNYGIEYMELKINRNILIESSIINDDVINYINEYRNNIDYNTIIICSEDITEKLIVNAEKILFNKTYIYIAFGKLTKNREEIMKIFNEIFIKDIRLIQKSNIFECIQYSISEKYLEYMNGFKILYKDVYPYLSLVVASYLAKQKSLNRIVCPKNEEIFSAFTFSILARI
jgi:hypothetical protein